MDTTSERYKEEQDKTKEMDERHPLFSSVRRIMLAGVGAIALTYDELEEFIDRLVERGEIAKKDAEELRKEMRERRSDYWHGEGSRAHKRVTEFMDRFSVPTKNDLDDLSAKIASLEKKIDKLTQPKV